jgi:hypothetical protein
VKPVSLVKSIWLLNKGSLPHYQRNHHQNSWCGWKSSGLWACIHCKWYTYSNCSWRTHHNIMHTTCSAACIRQTRVILYSSQYALFHINCSCTSPSSMVYHKMVNNTHLPDTTINGMKHVGSEIYIEVTSPHTCETLQLLHHHHGLCWELTPQRGST